ncbi:MAG: hypothetical protein CVT94_15325 [Bacteroidetes bacterium HGW-Bacteroidetes-11]|nr:MAG: hypothetical protein CVT94_15325 [Bacteroidetes bacterium HGW-Bacteroidetes-11]
MKRHICFIIPSIGVGGAERVVSILANYMASIDYKVSIICLVKNIAYPIDQRVQFIFPHFSIKRDLSTLIKVIPYYRKAIREIKPDVILSFLEFYNEITMLSLLGIRKKIFLFDRNNPFLKEQTVVQTILRRFLYPKANGIVVQTKHAGEFISKRKFNSNVLILPNPLSEINKFWYPSSERKTIVCVGRIEKQKNQKYLIDIFFQLYNDGWVLQFVGDGSYRVELEEYVNLLRMNNQVIFSGISSDVQTLLSESTIFAFPSLWEGFPNALLEAMAVGVPCISNNCPTGPAELIKDGENGFLVEIGDIDGFKNKLFELMNNADLRHEFSKNCRNIRNQFSVEDVTKKLLKYIEPS